MDPAEIAGKRVAEIGAGVGRIVSLLLDWGAAEVVAIEPSDAVHALRANLACRADADRVRIIQARGEDIPRENFDMVFSIGVLHHIPNPVPVVRAAHEALAPGGRFIAWLYGYEGNEAYLLLVRPLRMVTTRLPHRALAGIARGLNLLLDAYIAACRRGAPLPLRAYVLRVIANFSRERRFTVIYDQLNPAYAKYYRRTEGRELFMDAGFHVVHVYHRHGYSWTLIGDKQDQPASKPSPESGVRTYAA
jgi:SAM-dependent methyltransferase